MNHNLSTPVTQLTSSSNGHIKATAVGAFVSISTDPNSLTESPIDYVIFPVSKRSQLIGDEFFRILNIIISIFLFAATSLFGIVVNILNIIVYKRHGLKESIILGFFTLSLSDLILVSCPLGYAICITADILFPDAPIHFSAFHFVLTGNVREVAYIYSNVLTAMLSIERCCCIILPFKVKAIFTRDRSRAVIIVLLIVIVLGYAPILSTVQLRWMGPPGTNSTKTLQVWFAPYRKMIHSYSFYIIAILTPTTTLLLVTFNTFIMIYGLQTSSKFRKMAAGSSEDTSLSSRDTRLVKTMVFLGGILTLCNLPYIVFVYAMIFEPELEFGMAYNNMYVTIYISCYLLTSVNASANIFVYYNNSTRYRQIFDEMFGCLRINKTNDKKSVKS